VSKKKPAAAPAQTSAEYLTGAVERQMDHMRAYRSRQDDIVRSLGAVQKLLELGSFEAAKAAMVELLSRDLKQAKDRQDNHRFALGIAIKALENADRYDDDANKRYDDALSQIEILVPEAFDAALVPAGVKS